MVRKHIRKTTRASTPSNIILRAVREVKIDKNSIRSTATKCDIPFCSKILEEELSNVNSNFHFSYQLNREIFFTVEEAELSEYLRRASYKYFGLYSREVRSTGCANPSGWMKKEHFLKFAKHSVKNIKCTKEQPVLLLLDNHDSHLWIDALNFLKYSGVCVLSVCGTFKKYINTACDAWMRNHSGSTMTIYDIPGIVNTALPLAVIQNNIVMVSRKLKKGTKKKRSTAILTDTSVKNTLEEEKLASKRKLALKTNKKESEKIKEKIEENKENEKETDEKEWISEARGRSDGDVD
ncbi:hypothetical protein NQ314_014151 [Rhamnusium bicolor]|uniref:DDE-1 domain-containing protein n=1 Tax=Rhamnusium bicolor TaxID=1586634 RepID=A0AAV8X2F9_9CUCU|nr:hypothetical protein NQ314_014151 [Rhamnusium bicolor]